MKLNMIIFVLLCLYVLQVSSTYRKFSESETKGKVMTKETSTPANTRTNQPETLKKTTTAYGVKGK